MSNSDARGMAVLSGGMGATAVILVWLFASFVNADFSVSAKGLRVLIAVTVLMAVVGFVAVKVSDMK